jgi:Rho GDP-dissociation inhibitor
MAEQEPTAEQLAQIAAENEEDEHSVNYKPPAQKSIQEIQELDKDDESLRKYKEALLGRVAVSAGRWLGGRMSSKPVPSLFPDHSSKE